MASTPIKDVAGVGRDFTDSPSSSTGIIWMKFIRLLASFYLLPAWFLGVNGLRVDTLVHRSQREERATPATDVTCKPPLPSILLQLDPPSADHEVLRPLLVQLESTASTDAAIPGVDSISLGIVGPQGLIWSKGFGKAKANETDSTKPNEHTIYRIASISKLFATIQGWVMQEKGIINWDDCVTKYIPSFRYNPQTWKEYIANNRQPPSNTEDLDPITLRQLASHTSGIGRDLPYYNLDSYPDTSGPLPPSTFPSFEQQLQAIAQTPLVAQVNSFPVYSNTGFSVLGNALAAASSQAEGRSTTYAELVKRDVFTPLGMNGSSFLASAENAANLAVPTNGSIEVDFQQDDSFNAPGGQFSSLSDLAHTIRYLLNPLFTSAPRLIRPSTIRGWLRPSFPHPDSATETGLVWEILKLVDSHGRIQRFYGKGGDLKTFHSEVYLNQDLQFGVAVLNAGAGVAPIVAISALQLLLPGYESILEARTKDRYAGVWKGNGENEIDVVVEGGLLSITKWKVNGYDFLQIYEAGVLDRVSLWSTGKLDEFRIAVGSPGANTDPLWGCFPYWARMDALSSRHAPVDLLYFEGEGDQRVMRFPSANATLHR